MADKKKVAGAVGGGIVGVFALAAVHPLIVIAAPVAIIGGLGYGGYKGVEALTGKKKGPKQ